MKIKKNKNEIVIDNSKYCFKYNIERYIEFPKIIVIMFMSEDDIPDNNIIGIDYNGKIQWNIADIIKFDYPEAYITLSKENEKIFSVTSYNGVKFLIDTELREIVKKTITK